MRWGSDRLRWPRAIWKRPKPFVKLAAVGGKNGQERAWRENIRAKKEAATA